MDLDRLTAALQDVQDPEIPVSIVDMGLIVDIAEQNGIVDVKLTFTAMGCPGMDMIMDDVRARLLDVPGVHDVVLHVVWDPVWTPARLSSDGRQALLEMGIAV